jgi:hypothetical protein
MRNRIAKVVRAIQCAQRNGPCDGLTKPPRADLSGQKHDDFAGGSGEFPNRAEHAKTALTIFDEIFAAATKMPPHLRRE